jgi:ribulose-5-phosphate 4-epimerase/fuculose-1-phosphate aldolase
VGQDVGVVAEVVAAHRALAVAGHSDLVWGHAAVRDPGGRGVWTKAAGWGLEEVGREQVVLVSPSREVLVGAGSAHIECFIHTELMLARADIGATVHSHASAAAAFASLGEPLRPLSHDAVPFLDPDVVRFTATGDLIATPELGKALASAVGGANGCLIPGHGLVTVGSDAAAAVMHASLLNRACMIQLQAAAAGGPRLWSPDAEVAAKRMNLWNERQIHAGYDYLLRRADVLFGTPLQVAEGSSTAMSG